MEKSGLPDIEPPKTEAPAPRSATLRDRIVQATPAFIVNSASNVIGAMHIAAEVLMLKASGVVFFSNTRHIRPFIDKIKGYKQRESNMFAAARAPLASQTFASAADQEAALTKAIKTVEESDGYKAIKKAISDTKNEMQATTKIGVNPLTDPPRNLFRALTGADSESLQQNQWSTRATTSGFAAWVLGSIMPDRPDSLDRNKSDEQLLNNSKAQYAGRRLFEAVQIGNPDTKRQQIGLGVTMAGLFSFVSGFNNIDLKRGVRVNNWWHAAGGLITALSGANLLFAKTDRDGWQGFGSTLWLRLPLAGMAVRRKYTSNDRWMPYLGGQVMFQSAALYAYLFGGVKKLPDGTIVETNDSHHPTQVAEASVPKLTRKPKSEASITSAQDTPATVSASLADIAADQSSPPTRIGSIASAERLMETEQVQHVSA